jgi:hypothetical protein
MLNNHVNIDILNSLFFYSSKYQFPVQWRKTGIKYANILPSVNSLRDVQGNSLSYW